MFRQIRLNTYAGWSPRTGLFGQVAPSSDLPLLFQQPQRRTDLPAPPPRSAIPLSEHHDARSANAALDVQRTCPARRPERGLPDEHVHRCPADRVVATWRRCWIELEQPRCGRLDERGARARSTRSPSTASSSRAATPSATALSSFFREVRESREQLRMTVLTTLQCNFACDYCIQGDHGDYNKNAAKMSLETAARVADWAEQRLEACGRESLRADLLRRRAAAQPAGDVLPRRADVEGLRRARRPHADQHHHQRPAADPGDRRSAERLRPERHQDHARRRSRHAQPDAAAARRPGHLRPDRRQHPAGRAQTRIAIGGNFDMETARQLSGAARLPSEQEFADKLSKVAFKPIIREQKPAAPARASSRSPRSARRQAARRRVHDVGGRGRAAASATAATSSTTRWRSCARKRRSAASRPSTACTWARANPPRTRTPSARTARSTPARASPAMPRSRSATSTAAGATCAARGLAIRGAVGVAGVPRLLLHSHLRRRLHGRRVQRARQHRQAQLPQDGHPGRPRVARAAGCRRAHCNGSTSYVTTTVIVQAGGFR